MAKNVLTHDLSVPLDGTKAATVDIDTDSGNLTIDRLTEDEQLLANGRLQYFERQGQPTQTLSSSDGRTTLVLRGGHTRRTLFRLPWAACIGAYEWRIHLNPEVSSDISAHSGGGNVRLDLSGMAVSRVSAETGGGNVDVVLPEDAANLSASAKTGAGNVSVEIGSAITGSNSVDAKSGAGNVVVRVPSRIAAELHANSGLGKVIVDSRFEKVDGDTYRSLDYEGATDRVEITLNSGAGNVSVTTKQNPERRPSDMLVEI
jgi:predicted membrane protein